MKNFNNKKLQEAVKSIAPYFTMNGIATASGIKHNTFYSFTRKDADGGKRSPTPEQLERIVRALNVCQDGITAFKYIETGFITKPLKKYTESDFLN